MSRNSRRSFLKKSIITSFGAIAGNRLLGGVDYFENPDHIALSGDPDWKNIRDQFYLTDERTYLNNASLGPSPKIVTDTVCKAMKEHEKASETFHSKVKDVRKTVATFLNAKPEEIALTRNATEGINIVARGLRLEEGDEVLMTTHEHVGGASPWMALEENGVKVNLVDLDLEGEMNYAKIISAITEKTKVVFVSHICCTTGMILPVKAVCRYCRNKDIISCVDGAQALGQIELDLEDIGADFYAASGHKWLMGPKGTGILYMRNGSRKKLSPTFVGAYTVKDFDLNKLEMKYESAAESVEYGTRNTPIDLGVQRAFDFIAGIGMEKVESRCRELASMLMKGLKVIEDVTVISPSEAEFRSGIVSFKIKGKDYIKVRNRLSSKGFRTRGIYENGLSVVRVSCGIHVGDEDIRSFLQSVKSIADT